MFWRMDRMKIQCDVCERAEAAVLCCADEAALCWVCDEKVHAANKVARKHNRVPLLPRNSSSSSDPSWPSSTEIPACDICQGKAGYFFCVEDRALLCQQCDVATHTASPYVSSHQRFLIAGVRVGLQHCVTDDGNNNNSCDSSSSSKANSSNCCGGKTPLSSLPSTDSVVTKMPQADPVGYAVEDMESLRTQWSWNEFFDGAEFEQKWYGVSKPGSSS